MYTSAPNGRRTDGREVLDALRGAKVGELDEAGVVDKDVGALDVAVGGGGGGWDGRGGVVGLGLI